METILGISAFYHDSAAVLLANGEIVAAAQEERFTRKKHDAAFPVNSIRYVLEEGGICADFLSAVIFYEKPFLKFERLLETYHAFAPKGLLSFTTGVPVWIKEKLFMKRLLRKELAAIGIKKVPLLFSEHHCSHAASAFFPSPFEEAAILTIDGVGEWVTTSLCYGKKNNITVLKELHFPHSVGLLYSSFTHYIGFKVNSGEYKLMGLAPFGAPCSKRIDVFKQKILSEMVDIRDDGCIFLNMEYFNFATGLKMTNDLRWMRLFGFPPRKPESAITEDYIALASAIQLITEDIVLKLACTTKNLTKSNNLVLAGGVSLNCVSNGKLLREKIFKNIWIQPAAGDAGGALGAALAGWHIWKKRDRLINEDRDIMKGAFLGPEYTDKSISNLKRIHDAHFQRYDDFDELCNTVASVIVQGNIVGWFQGRMEFGPRALGNRSILGDPRNPDMQKKMNLKIKYRESFRPFAPAVLEEDRDEYFNLDCNSPYMLFVASIQGKRRLSIPDQKDTDDVFEALSHPHSDIPAVTHVDYSSRVQTVSEKTNPRFWKLLFTFRKLTGCSVLINTSFNVRGEPIVCTPEDAYRCFMRTEMDYLVLGDFLFKKSDQPALQISKLPQKISYLD